MPKNRSRCSLSRRAVERAAIAGQHVHGRDRLVHEAVTKRRGFDADSRHRAAEGDGLELRHDRRHRPLRERRIGKIDECRHALRVDDAVADRDDAVEVRQVDAAARCAARGRGTGSTSAWRGRTRARRARRAMPRAPPACPRRLRPPRSLPHLTMRPLRCPRRGRNSRSGAALRAHGHRYRNARLIG